MSEHSPVFGLADLHCHWTAHLAFGGHFLWDRPDGPLAKALSSSRPHHGLCGLGLASLADGRPDLGSGFPKFNSWPNRDLVAHQQMHIDWVDPAWQASPEVSLALNNELLALLTGSKSTHARLSTIRQKQWKNLRGSIPTSSYRQNPGAGTPHHLFWKVSRRPLEIDSPWGCREERHRRTLTLRRH